MKTFARLVLAAACGAWLTTTAPGQSEAAAPTAPPAEPTTPRVAENESPTTTTTTVALPRDERAPAVAADNAKDKDKNKDKDNPPPTGEPSLRLNFRGVPLEMVLDYLSDAAGFIIILDTTVSGKVDVWSNQPLNRDEAVELLNTVLAKNGYTAIRNGRTLTIVSRDDAKKRDIPVRAGADPTGIPKSEEIVTQIIPVRFIGAVQLARDLQPLIPTSATVASNEGGNALVITDTQTSIRRLAEIIRALDTSIASVTSVRVFELKYADAKALATTVRDLFQTTDSTSGRTGNQQQQNFFRGFRGAGGGGFPGGGFPGGGGNAGGDSGAAGSARVNTPKVVAVADERSNSLVVAAPEEQMTVITDLVQQVDRDVEDVTELRVFRLAYADPQEMSEVIANLFPDPTTSSNNNQNRGGQIRFGGGPFGGGNFGGGNRGGGTSADSTRLQKQTKVVAVPDLRTGSIVVSAAHALMEQIASVIAQLDADPAKKQKVFVFDVQNTDPTAVADILKGLFETQTSRNRTTSSSNNRQNGNQLSNRANQNQTQGQRSSSFGGGNTSGFGSGGQTGR